MSYHFERLAKQDRSRFDCGVPALDTYFQKQASQDQRKRFSVCWLAVENETGDTGGFYTLSSASVDISLIPEDRRKKLPRYPLVPVARVGRLAVDRTHQGRGLGAAMLFDAIQRCATTDVGIYAIMVDAKDESAVRFYEHCGLTLLPGFDRNLYLALKEGLDRLWSNDLS